MLVDASRKVNKMILSDYFLKMSFQKLGVH